MKRAFSILAVMILSAPPVSGGPVPFSSDNVSLVFHVPDPGGVGGRFVGRTFYLTTAAGLRIYDASTPELPVLVGTLPLPHFENEDVDVSRSRKLVLVSADRTTNDAPGALFVIDVANPRVPVLKSVLRYPGFYTQKDGRKVGGPGHIANCIADCKRYAWITGARDGSIVVVDLKDPANPKLVKRRIISPAGAGNGVFTIGTVHDVNEDGGGNVWLTGSGGTAMLDARNPLKPSLRFWTTPADNKRTNQFIHHNSLRLSRDIVLVTEEDWEQPQCGGIVGDQGSFQTWRIPRTSTGALRPISQWKTKLGTFTDGRTPVAATCSSHWFSFNRNRVVSVGWYNQGVRFLDVSNPAKIRQVGYWLAPGEIGLGVSQALFVPGAPDVVYAVSYNRGLDVLKIARGGRGEASVMAPAPPVQSAPVPASPHPTFGWACVIPRAS